MSDCLNLIKQNYTFLSRIDFDKGGCYKEL